MKYDPHVPWGHSRPRSRLSQWWEYHNIGDWSEIKWTIIAIIIVLLLAGAEGSLFVR
jgi:hypothetical protein